MRSTLGKLALFVALAMTCAQAVAQQSYSQLIGNSPIGEVSSTISSPPAPALSLPPKGALSCEHKTEHRSAAHRKARRAAMGRGSDGTMEPAGAETQTEAQQTSPGLRRRPTSAISW